MANALELNGLPMTSDMTASLSIRNSIRVREKEGIIALVQATIQTRRTSGGGM